MPPDRKPFKNPLTQASTDASTFPLPSQETATLPATETPTAAPTMPSMVPATKPSTETYTFTESTQHRKRGEQAFERTHARVTLWLDKQLKDRFEALSDAQGMAKSTLLNEAIADLLTKYQR